jgi:hypothetical protein
VRTLFKITAGLGVATLLFAGYVALNALPDLARYIRMQRM